MRTSSAGKPVGLLLWKKWWPYSVPKTKWVKSWTKFLFTHGIIVLSKNENKLCRKTCGAFFVEVMECQWNRSALAPILAVQSWPMEGTARSIKNWWTRSTKSMDGPRKKRNAMVTAGQKYELPTLVSILCASNVSKKVGWLRQKRFITLYLWGTVGLTTSETWWPYVNLAILESRLWWETGGIKITKWSKHKK